MKLFKKERTSNGISFYFCGIKIFSYHKNKLKIYMPHYNKNVLPSSIEPEIYNKDGKKMRTFFLRDSHMAIDPTGASKYFVWDKFNIGLNVHFYSHNSMLETMGNPQYKFGFLIETEGIVPSDYKIFIKNKNLANQFKYIFTNSKFILDTVENAKFAPMNASLYNGSFCKEDNYKYKNKNVSILSSDKSMCKLHKFRYDLANLCKKENLCDTFGTFDGGKFVSIDTTLRNYRYSICIENIQTPYLFTERLICTFANQTIPIYLGATEIEKFFNIYGIICITQKSNIKEILKRCTNEEYQKRLPAIIDNYFRAKKYINTWDYIYETYLQNLIN